MQRFAALTDDGWIKISGAFTIPNVTLTAPGGPVDPDDPDGEQKPPITVLGDQRFAANWLGSSTPQDRAAWNIKAYAEADPPPPNKRSVGTRLVDANGSPREIHDLVDIPIAERRAAMIQSIDADRDRRQQRDYIHDFGILDAVDEAGQGIAAGQRALQMRFDPDQRNWQALQSQAVVAVMAGQGATVMPMRAEDNWNVQTTAADVLAVTSAMFVRNASILFYGAALKSQVRAALTGSDLDAINITVSWPG